MNLLFLCTGNSCRSQMAEGWARRLGGDWLQVQSAGIESHGKNPRAIVIMEEAGVDIAGQESTALTDDALSSADIAMPATAERVWRAAAAPAPDPKS